MQASFWSTVNFISWPACNTYPHKKTLCQNIKQHVKISNFDVFHVEFIISTFIFYEIISVTECFLLVWSILLESIRSGGTKCFFKFEFGVTEDKLIDVSKYCFYCNISRWVCDIVDFVNKNFFSQIDKSTMWYGVNLDVKSVYEGFICSDTLYTK